MHRPKAVNEPSRLETMKDTTEIRLSYQDYTPDSGMPPRLWFVKVKVTTRDENSNSPDDFVKAVETTWSTSDNISYALESIKNLAIQL